MTFTNNVCHENDNELLALLKGYSALLPPLQLKFPVRCSFTEAHTFILHQILLDPHLEQYSPSGRYQQSFWKWAIEHLERMVKDEEVSHYATIPPEKATHPRLHIKDGEIDARIYDRYMSLMSGFM